jgi:hypothetical protein
VAGWNSSINQGFNGKIVELNKWWILNCQVWGKARLGILDRHQDIMGIESTMSNVPWSSYRAL